MGNRSMERWVSPAAGSLRVLAGLAALWWLAGAAHASPWTAPAGTTFISVGTAYSQARNEFLSREAVNDFDLSARRRFPLDGQLQIFSQQLSLRYGVTDRIEVGAGLALKYIVFDAEPIYMGAPIDELSGTRQLLDGVYDFDRHVGGLGDLLLVGRYRLTSPARGVAALELEIKVPTGYNPPGGTFEIASDGTQTNVVDDDVALGDGQADLTLQLLLGFATRRGGFLRSDLGIRFRNGGPGQQVIGSMKIGRSFRNRVIPYLGVSAEHSFTEGNEVGTTLIARDPSVHPADFAGGNVVAVPFRLDRSVVSPTAGAIIRMPTLDLDLAYRVVAWGRNVSATHQANVTMSFRIDRRSVE